MTSRQIERVINKNYRNVLRNLSVGINGYELLILRKIMFSILIIRFEIQNMRLFFLSVYFTSNRIRLALNKGLTSTVLNFKMFPCFRNARNAF